MITASTVWPCDSYVTCWNIPSHQPAHLEYMIHDVQVSTQPPRTLCASQTMTPFGTQISSSGSLSLSTIRRWVEQDPARSCDPMISQSLQQCLSASLICVCQAACLKPLRQLTTTEACPAFLGALHCTTSESSMTHSRWSLRVNCGVTSAFRLCDQHLARLHCFAAG